MREQLIQYVNLLFAGTANTADIRQEILQNTLDRYDDLISQGKSPEAAYRLTISGIGDVSELINQAAPAAESIPQAPGKTEAKPWQTLLRAGAVMLWILCPVPLFILQDELGLCLLLAMVAVATAMSIIAGNESKRTSGNAESDENPMHKGVSSLIWAIGIVAYLAISFFSGAWYITWLIFPITAAVKGLVYAIMDLKEAK